MRSDKESKSPKRFSKEGRNQKDSFDDCVFYTIQGLDEDCCSKYALYKNEDAYNPTPKFLLSAFRGLILIKLISIKTAYYFT